MRNIVQKHYPFKSATGKSHLTLKTHKNKHPLRSNSEGSGYKIHLTDSKHSNNMASGGRKVYYLLSSVLAVSLGTCIRYAFVLVYLLRLKGGMNSYFRN